MRSSRRRRRSAFRRNNDFNGADQEGAGYYQTTTRNGRRGSTARTYLRAARERRNLKIETNALAQRLRSTASAPPASCIARTAR